MSARTISLPFVNFCALTIIGFFGAFLSHRADKIPPPRFWKDFGDGGCFVPLCTHAHLNWHDVVSWERTLTLIDVVHLRWNVGLLALFPLMGIYPFMKRITYWPQAWLEVVEPTSGVAINIGVSMAWATTTASIPTSSLVLSAGCFLYKSTLPVDTIYACQDKRDDVNAGVKSTALLFGSRIKRILTLFGTIFTCSLTISGILNGQSLLFFVLAVFGGALHLAWQLYTVDVDSPTSCWRTVSE
ncbi:hypothetical protein C0995_015259 [Termitomyces sp. Mi166|nr:hypothetical protein C0995_015259 [Termitomyces sp. Mi166\